MDELTLAIDVVDGPGAPGSLVADSPYPAPSVTLPSSLFFTGGESSKNLLERRFVREFLGRIPSRPTDAGVQLTGQVTDPERPNRDDAPKGEGVGLLLKPSDWRDAIGAELRAAAAAGLVVLYEDAEIDSDGSSLGAPNIDVRTAYDSITERQGLDRTARLCPEQDMFDFLFGPQPAPGLHDISSLRKALVDERGAVDPSGARMLMNAYLTFGFGAEAVQLVDMVPFDTDDRRMWLSLARIVDHRTDGAIDVWRGLEACPSPTALWAVLGQPLSGIRSVRDTAAVQRAFFALPTHLRLHLGPTLAERLELLGENDASTAVRGNVDALLRPIPASTLPDSDESGERPAAPVVSKGQAEQVVTDLLARIETGMRSGTPISMKDLAAAEALTWEYRGTPTGDQLLGATVLGRLQAGEIDGTLELLEAGALEITDDPRWSASLRLGMGTAVSQTGDAALLEIALHPQSQQITNLLPPAARFETAIRLIDLGFADPGLRLLSGLPDTGGDAVRLAEARGHLVAGDPRQALARLAGRSGIEAEEVRADAHFALENHELAAEAYAAAGNADAAALSAWLSGDRATIDSFGTEQQKAAADALAQLREARPPRALGSTDNPVEVAANSPPNLADVRDLIDRSSTLRASLEEIVAPVEGDP